MVAEIIIVSPNQRGLESAKQAAQVAARSLTALGAKVREQVSLCGGKVELQKAVAAALERSNVAIILGGLGHEDSYLTKTVITQGLRLSLVQDEVCLDEMRAYCKRSGEPFAEQDTVLAQVPQGAAVFPGQYGKIPGIAVSSSNQHILMLPDNQTEVSAMFSRYIAPYLTGPQAQSSVIRTIRSYGLSPEAVQLKLGDLLSSPNPAVTLEREGNEVLVRVSAHAPSSGEANALCTPVLRAIAERLGDAAYGLDVDSMQAAVINKLKKKMLGLAVAESGSGGMLTRVLAETPGGAEVLRYSVAVDDDAAKREKLGLTASVLRKSGGVSEQAAVAMAASVREKAGTTLGVAITANTVAEEQKKKSAPGGLVYIAVCDANNVYVKKLVVGNGDPRERDAVVDAALSRALNMVRLFVDYLPGSYSAAIPLEDALAGQTVTDKESYTGDDGQPVREEPQGFFRRLGGNFIIRKADEPRTKVRKVIFILAVLIFIGSAGYVGNYYLESFLAKRQAKALQEIFTYGEMEDMERDDNYPRDYLDQFIGLWNINPDVVGYLSIDDTQVQYPIVQSTDNDYYLRRDFYEKSNQHGIPFADYKADIKKPSDNIVIYGHNMKDGQLFGELMGYKELDYIREHPIIHFTSVYDDNLYKIVSVFVTNAYAYSGEDLFEYHNFSDAYSEEHFNWFVEQITWRSYYNFPDDVQYGDKLITLSTCSYEFNEARTVVVARALRPGEDADVDAGKITENKNRLMPDIWYSTFGGTRPAGAPTALGTMPARATSGGNISVSRPTNTSSSQNDDDESSESSAVSQYAPPPQTSSSTASSSSQASSTTTQSSGGGQSSQSSSQASSSSAAESSSSQESSEEESSEDEVEEASSRSSEEESSSSKREDNLFDNLDDRLSESSSEDDSSDEELERSYPSDSIFADLSAGASGGSPRGTSRLQVMRATTSQLQVELMSGERSIFDGWDDFVPPKGETYSDDEVAQNVWPGPSSSSGSSSSSSGSTKSSGSKAGEAGIVKVYAGGKTITGDAQEIVARIVQNEIGSSFHEEAIKAQAVAAYTYIKFNNASGQTPSVILASPSAVSSKVEKAVSQVIGEGVYYNGKLCFTPYHATSAGQTTSSRAVWGGGYAYLVSVESPVDKKTTNYKVTRTYTSDDVSNLLYTKLGIDTWGDPGDWFEILSYTDGDYVGDMAICGETKSLKTGNKITGRMLRENVLGLRSACFDITYNSGNDTFTFTTYGYGHGVGLSQNGANLYAQQGWDYVEILEHYYPGAIVE